MIKQIHLSECDSTQDVLKEQLNNPGTVELLLVSCENQKSGRGRGEKKWSAMPGSLCFSINLKPNPVLSFTAIELAVIIADFFNLKGKELKLKWPNDLWTLEHKKCGGILVQGNQGNLLGGIGLNLHSSDPEFGGLYSEAFAIDKKLWAHELTQFIHEHRYLDATELTQKWLTYCGHLNQMVKITEGEEIIEGIFQGLGDFGEALICCDSKIRKFYNGSLILNQA